jgi:predicted phosphoadenosine phosphosulfate sulfurtransferase
MRQRTGADVFSETLDRIRPLYEQGDRIVVSFSGGKDSCVVLELAILAAAEAGRLPVEVCLRDEEVLFPGSYEYVERVASRPEVDFMWCVARKPMLNVFNRRNPFWWIFDDRLDPADWVRPYPELGVEIDEPLMTDLIHPRRYPLEPGQRLVVITGLRAEESRFRAMSISATKGHMTKHPKDSGAYYSRPIYDWQDGDVWKAIRDGSWDYNRAYDSLYRLGINGRSLRIGPPTMNAYSLNVTKAAAVAWPKWFDKVNRRLPGVRTAVQFGLRGLQPDRLHGEEWHDTYQRTCIDTAPQWIAERAEMARTRMLGRHRLHSTAPFPEHKACSECGPNGSWRGLGMNVYLGDPFCSRTNNLLPIETGERFRDGPPT